MLSEKTASNRLSHEKSPYLLAHARNPVDWYPWGEDAFKKARREDKPLFLSIGYSTCQLVPCDRQGKVLRTTPWPAC